MGFIVLSVEVRKKVEYLCQQIADGAEVKLEDMVWLSKYAKANTGVREKLRRARRAQRAKKADSMDEFCDMMDLGDPDPSNHVTGFNDADEIVEWFKQDKCDDWRQRD